MTVVAIFSGLVLLTAAILSLHWRFERDSPLMVYAGWLVAHGAVPYRDFFDMNMPGTYFIMSVMGYLFGWSAAGFRIFDLIILGGISSFTFLWMRRFGKLSAFIAAVLFPLWYLYSGPAMSMQREYMELLPLSAMLAAASLSKSASIVRTAFILGFLTGLGMLIKPQFVIFLFPLLSLVYKHNSENVRLLHKSLALIGGILLLPAAVFLYLLFTGGLIPFLDMAFNYLPLYSHLTGSHEPISGLNRLLYIGKSTISGLMRYYTLIAAAGIFVLKFDKEQTAWYRVIIVLLISAAIYPALSGQFWGYHWIPFIYASLCAASLSAEPLLDKKMGIIKVLPVIALMAVVLYKSARVTGEIYESFRNHTYWNANEHPQFGIPDDVSNYLNRHMKKGDTVQPLDWTGGAIYGMLIAKAPLATRFMYDFYFYHHINSPYIIGLRKEFIKELHLAEPRFIVQVLKDKQSPVGANTTTEFPELTTILNDNYSPVLGNSNFTIYERKGSK